MRSKQWYMNTSGLPNSLVNSSMAYTTKRATVTKRTTRKTIKRGPGKRMVEGRNYRLADEVRYIQRKAADYDSRVVSIGQIVLFSTESGDAWLLDPAEGLAARVARDGDPEPIHVEDTETTFRIGWKGQYRIDGDAFVYLDGETGKLTSISGYPIEKLSEVLWET